MNLIEIQLLYLANKFMQYIHSSFNNSLADTLLELDRKELESRATEPIILNKLRSKGL